MLGVVQQGLDTRLRKGPGASVERLLLGPDNGLGVGVLVQVLLQLLPWEGVELLNAGDGGVVELVLGAMLNQRGVDLAGAENDAVDLFGGRDLAGLMCRVRDDPLEVGVTGKVLNVRAGNGVAQERLREEDDEGYREMLVIENVIKYQ